jgi:hypothetical protein
MKRQLKIGRTVVELQTGDYAIHAGLNLIFCPIETPEKCISMSVAAFNRFLKMPVKISYRKTNGYIAKVYTYNEEN